MPTPLTDERVETNLGKQQVFCGGRVAPLVYLHSATGESAMAPAVLEGLADSYDVVAAVFPGFGQSEGIEKIDGPEDAAFHLLDVIDQLGLERPALMGMSFGGWMAAELACRWPDRVSRLVLVNAVGLHLDDAPIKEIFGRDPGELAEDLFADQEHPLAQAMHQMSTLSQMAAEIPFDLIKPVLQSLAATARVGWNPYLHNPKLPQRLYRVTVPALVVRGSDDRLVPAAHADRWVTLLPDARRADVAGAGHLVALEKPAELAALAREFLSS